MYTLFNRKSLAVFSLLLFGVGLPAHAQPLTTAFTYQGELQISGLPAAGSHDLRFRLYDAAAGGLQIGATLCSDNVALAEARFTVSLDFGAAFTGQQLFLEIEARADIGLDCLNATGFVILSPRQPLTAAPNAAFALTAASAITADTASDATKLDGLDSTFYQNAANLSAGILADLRLSSNVALLNNAQTFTGAKTLSNAANLFTGTFTGPGTGLTLLNAGNIASGTLADLRLSSNVALLNNAQTFSAAKTFGVAPSFTAAGSPFSVSATGLVTNLNADRLDGLNSTAFLQSVPNPLTLSGTNETHIIRGGNASTANGSAGVLGVSTAASGINSGVSGQSASMTGYGVYGVAFAGSGVNYGVYGLSNSSSGYGVYGISADNVGVSGVASRLSGVNYGVVGVSDSASGYGVSGWASFTGAASTPYGVRGTCSTATLGFGVFASGDLGASGVKPFRIDHPTDPANKYLLHYSSESPFPQNFYNGNVTTDANGFAWVELPEYFAEINTNFKYQLTVIGKSFAQAIVSEEIAENRFQIQTNQPNVKVSWEVKADRNDLRIKANRPTDEREKTGLEKGKYQHPEYYGLPKEMSMDYIPEREGPAASDRAVSPK